MGWTCKENPKFVITGSAGTEPGIENTFGMAWQRERKTR